MQLMDAEDKRSRCGTGECVLHLAQSETPCTRRRSSYGTWEASSPPRVASLGRITGNTGKAVEDERASDGSVVCAGQRPDQVG